MTGHPGARTARGFRAIVTLAVFAAALVVPGGASRVAASPSPENPAKLIYAGWYGNTIPTPSFVANNFAFLESQPFDGIVVYLRSTSLGVNMTTGVMKNTAISYDSMMAVLNPIANLDFVNLTDNLGLVQGSTPPDFFDDWSVVIQNYSNLALAAKNSGLKGICFDNEQYAAAWGNYGSNLKYFATKTLSQYEIQARLRGKQIMEAMVAQFPDIVFLTLHGPYVSEPDAPTALEFPQWQSGNELMGPFFAGHLEGAGQAGCVMDGGELYSLRSEGEFQASADWRRDDLPSDAVNSTFIPASLRSIWPDRVSISFGVYDCPFWGEAMNSTVVRSTLANAMRQADKYVWFYAEAATYLLPSNAGGASTSWVDAIRLARQDVEASIPPPPAAPAPAPAPSGPAAPSGLSASAVSPFDIDLAWADNSSDETSFEIERKTVVNGTWAQVATTQPGVTYLRNGSLWSGTGYVYRVRAVSADGPSAYTAEVTATTPSVQSFAAIAPSNLVATSVSTTEIDLTWEDNSSTESGFEIERRAQVNGVWALVTTCEAGATYHRDEALTPGQGYVYRVRAVNSVGASAYTAEASATTASPLVVAPSSPSNLAATAATPFDIDLSWTDNSSDETGFEIERKTVINGTWSLVATTQAGVTSLRNGSLWSATGYLYRVRAVNTGGASAFSSEAGATTPYVTQTPSAPTSLTASLVSNTETEIRWTDTSWNETGFKIERRRSGGSWTQVGMVGANATSYRDPGRTRGVTYVYRIRAYTSAGNSGYSNQARITMP